MVAIMDGKSDEVNELDSQAFLVLLEGQEEDSPEIGRRYVIPSHGLCLGNQADADVQIDSMGTLHITRRRNIWQLDIEGTRNSARVNGVLTQQCNVFDGDMIQIGKIAFEFCVGDSIRSKFFKKNEEGRLEDVLTKALNRRALLQFLEQDLRRYMLWETERRTNQAKEKHAPMSLVMLDIDHFGIFNKKYDVLVGDEVLKGVIERVKSRVRTTDIVARWGGEEFIIYLPNTPIKEATDLAEEVRSLIANSQFEVGSQKNLSVTISMGVTQFEPSMDINGFIRAADERMRLAKKEGRNRVL